MNQEKIGKLIAKLRKEKGLTQQDLGDKVGVGYRAVSKWENGLTMPDISIINELCQILGITTDELLKGEQNKKELPNKPSKKKLLFLLIPLALLITSIIFLIIEYNKEYIYELDTNDEYSYIEGKAIFKGNRLTLNINKIYFDKYSLNQTMIKNYQYKISANDQTIFGFGYNLTTNNIMSPMTIEKLMTDLAINYHDEINLSRKEIVNNNLTLEFVFIDEGDNTITKQIEMLLYPIENTNSTDQVEKFALKVVS